MFFVFGLLGIGIFFLLANAFYYTKVFAGGDAKLLMGFGIILPFESYFSLALLSILFVLLLFTVGAVYSIIYSGFLAVKNSKGFRKEFLIKFKKDKKLFLVSLALIIVLLVESIISNFDIRLWGIFSLFLLLIPGLYIYLKALENSCLIRLVDPGKLTEGDWLEKDVFLHGRKISKSVHGLNMTEIKMLQKAKKKVWVRYGIPFVPVFFFSLIIMVFFLISLKLDPMNFFSYLS